MGLYYMRQLGILENKMILRVSDSFSRADNPSIIGSADTGQSWTVLTGATWGVNSNKAYASAAYGGSCAWINSALSNCTVSATFDIYATSSGLIVRKNATIDIATLNCISLRSTLAGDVLLQRWDNGTPTTIGSITGLTLTNGDIWSLECVGSTIKAYQNGILRINATEASHTINTRHGLMASNTTVPRFGNFKVGAI